MSGKGVPQRMRMHRLVDARPPRRFSACFENGFARYRTTRLSAREKPLFGAPPPPVRHQHFAKLVREHDLAILVSLTSAHPDDLAVAIKVAHLQVDRLRDPESGP